MSATDDRALLFIQEDVLKERRGGDAKIREILSISENLLVRSA